MWHPNRIDKQQVGHRKWAIEEVVFIIIETVRNNTCKEELEKAAAWILLKIHWILMGQVPATETLTNRIWLAPSSQKTTMKTLTVHPLTKSKQTHIAAISEISNQLLKKNSRVLLATSMVKTTTCSSNKMKTTTKIDMIMRHMMTFRNSGIDLIRTSLISNSRRMAYIQVGSSNK